ncbi:MAG TPA: acyltransferase domain-containing protein [Herbaspirillum sp.]
MSAGRNAGAARLAILCPGQGGQHAGMFDLFRGDARAAGIFEGSQLEAILGYPLATVLNDDRLLFANRPAQVLVVAAALAAWEVLRDALPQPALVAGYSIGELAAYGVAGSLPVGDTLAIAARRADAMDVCAKNAPQGLMSVSGLEIKRAHALLQEHGAHVAIETGFDTLIAGGGRAALLASEPALLAGGARIGWLPVSVASHTPLMQGALDSFAQALAEARLSDPLVPVLAGISGKPIRDAKTAKEALSRQLSDTIHWSACMDACAESGITVALELGPGAALSGMLRARHPSIACRSLADFRSLQGVLGWLERELA